MASNENSFSDDIVPTARECPENTTAPFAAAAALSIDDDDDEFLIAFHTTGHYMKCFGCRCDFREVVLAVNAIHIGWYLAELFKIMDTELDDDPVILPVIGLAVGAIGIYGAFEFEQWGIITAMVFCILKALLIQSCISMFMAAMYLYPHVCMIRLMRAGIMTEDNYPTSCCDDAKIICGRAPCRRKRTTFHSV